MKSNLKNMLISLGGISLVMSALLATVHEVTQEPIEEAARKSSVQAVQAILPPFHGNPMENGKSLTLEGESHPVMVYPAFNDKGELSGVAVESYSMDGFSGEITVLVGFNPEGSLTGYRILKSAETPGLGAKAQEWFQDSKGHRSVIGSDTELLLNKDGGEVDAITAATITSRAFIQAVNRGRKAFEIYLESENSKA